MPRCLTAMIVAMVAGILASQLVHPKHLEHLVYAPPGAEAGATAAAAPAAAPSGPEPIAPYMAKADPARGQQTAKVCLQCHTFAKGEPNKIGPNLFGHHGRKHRQRCRLPILARRSSPTRTMKWDPDELNVWLYKPQEFANGTKMTFPGLPKPQDRADVIALSGKPEIGGMWSSSTGSSHSRPTSPMRRERRSARIFASPSRSTTSPICRPSPLPTAPPKRRCGI